jgi:hypothetical protein
MIDSIHSFRINRQGGGGHSLYSSSGLRSFYLLGDFSDVRLDGEYVLYREWSWGATTLSRSYPSLVDEQARYKNHLEHMNVSMYHTYLVRFQ